MSKPEDVGQLTSFPFRRVPGRSEILPHGDNHERQQYGVDDAQDSVDETGHVVVLPAQLRGHEALHHRQPNYRGEACPTNDQDAINYAHHGGEPSLFVRVRSRNPRYILRGVQAKRLPAQARKTEPTAAESPTSENPAQRSEEHTSELQSRQYLVCR